MFNFHLRKPYSHHLPNLHKVLGKIVLHQYKQKQIVTSRMIVQHQKLLTPQTVSNCHPGKQAEKQTESADEIKSSVVTKKNWECKLVDYDTSKEEDEGSR